MLNLIFFSTLALQVVSPADLNCLGFINRTLLPREIYVAGTEEERTTAFASQGGLVYLNGLGIQRLKAGELYRVARPEGNLRDPLSGEAIGVYYKELGTLRVETPGKEVAAATVMTSCQRIIKGDLVLPVADRPAIQFSGQHSTRLTPYPESGITSHIILGKDDIREMAAGQFCFIGVGARDGVTPGDWFTVYRPPPPFNPRDLGVKGLGFNRSYKALRPGRYPDSLVKMLRARQLPPQVLGDVVVVDVSETTAVAKIINSLKEIHLGDIVIKR